MHPHSIQPLKSLHSPTLMQSAPALADRAISPVDVSRAATVLRAPVRGASSPKWCAAALAMAATGTSACVSFLASWERGGQFSERLVWVGVGLVLLLGAHLLPALARSAPMMLRVPALMLWVLSMVATGYGHATFFMQAQRHAGELRAAAVDARASIATSPVSSGPDLTTIAIERARVTTELASATARKCVDRCTTQTLRRVALSSRLDALNTALEEARRRERADDKLSVVRDRQAVLRADAMSDPVTGRVALLLGTSTDTINLVVGLGFGAVLECIACLGWLLALHGAPITDTPSTTNSNAAVVAGNLAHGAGNDGMSVLADGVPAGNRAIPVNNGSVASGRSDGQLARDQDQTVTMMVAKTVSADLAMLATEVAAGRTRATVAEIRKLFRCSQGRAMALRRQFAEAMLEQPRAA
ncbi:hypothetical protein EVC45_29940 [Paraburkholderia sp. UYCP14C]|uniref:hypothetical protein n=1 Tax=Paraburkholderia sp. UYCP14C TaxID=2511130 RepID=UPI0010212DDA|nr:hypothetical protein [Paraburkholderia sp. UYCP14C]RZF26074.1 hypothetical protein EVC45_29940 [Paraburkholderia sp. UYCP14C]